MIKCSNCKDDFEINQPGHFQLDYSGTGECDVLCSLACFAEWAWKLRESQPKLSKSKQSYENHNVYGDAMWPTDY